MKVVYIKPSRSTNTKLAYIDRAESFVKQFHKKYLKDPSPAELVDFIQDKQHELSAATWRQYKNATIFFLESLDADVSELVLKLGQVKNEGIRLTAKKTSSLKQKYISRKDEVKLRTCLSEAAKDSTGWGRTMYAYFETILCTAIRPIEMSQAEFIEDESRLVAGGHNLSSYSGSFPVLVVKNAKNSNGRTFGEFRYVCIAGLNAKQHLLIKASIMMAAKMNTPTGPADDYSSFYRKLRGAFYRFIQYHFSGKSRRITLYTFRHQAIADLKHAGMSLSEIAALVGHGTDATATEHYGKRRVGRTREALITANLIDVEKVRRIHSTNPHTIPSSNELKNSDIS